MNFKTSPGDTAHDRPQCQLFVVGFARSGTSLLYSLLNLHPNIKLLYEADLLSQSLVNVSILTGQSWWERLDFFNSVCRRHRLNPQKTWKKISSVTEAAKVLYSQYGGKNHRYVGEKSPAYYNCLPALAHKFPAARFIVIWRNPQSVISSILQAGKKHYFFSNASFPLRAIVGLEQMQSDVLALRSRGIPIFDLCYESLVENPETWMRSICDFLDLPFDPRVLELDHADCTMFPPGEHHSKVKSGRMASSKANGAHALAAPLQAKINRYLSRWAALFQTQLDTRRYWPPVASEQPTSLEVLYDRMDYQLQRFRSEQFTPFVYGFFPLGLLRLYRKIRGHSAAPSSSSTIGVPRTASTSPLKVSVITPSYKQLPWLKLCIASIADQKGVTVEHIIQDAQSGPELEQWVRDSSKSQLYVECDTGMYDAIKRGIARATGDIICWLNSDEQFLEGSLEKVAHFFETHPEVDVLFGDALLVNNKGDILSYRNTVANQLHRIQASHLNALSSSTFVRRSIFERGYVLDTRWRAIAAAVWTNDILQAGIPYAVLKEPLSAFTVMDANLGHTSLALTESKIWQEELAANNLWMRTYFHMLPDAMEIFDRTFRAKEIAADIYTLSSPTTRVSRSTKQHGISKPKFHY